MAAAVFVADLQAKNVHLPQANIKSTPKTIVSAQEISPLPIQSIDSQNNKLQSVINKFVSSHSDHNWAVQLQGLNGDERSASYIPTTIFPSASIYKLLLMYPLIQKVPIDQWSSINLDVAGKNRSLTDCVTAMLKVSDNPCGVAVGDFVGWEYATGQLKLIGLQSTDMADADGPKTTPADTAYYLQGLNDGKWFDGATRKFILNTLDQQAFRQGIPTGCGSLCDVADKTGALNSARHDAAIIKYPGGAYVLAIFSDGASYSEIASLAGQLQTAMVAN